MRTTAVVLTVLVALAGCGHKSPTEKASDDAKDIAMVKQMSREPFKPIVPTTITADDVNRYGLDKPGCSFRKKGAGDPLFIAGRDEGYMHVGSDLKRFASKKESADLPGGARSTYMGLSSWVDLVRLPDAATGADDQAWPARLVVHDAQERVAFQADGVVTCHA